jgi:hypothetical protein
MGTLPYITSPGNIDKALAGIKNAAVPERVSQDFVKTILKITGGSGDQMTSYLKKLGLVNIDGTPSDVYRRFRNPASSGSAIAECIKKAYAPLFTRNEYANELTDTQLLSLIVEDTGQPHDSNNVKLIASCFKHLKSSANFSATSPRLPVMDVDEPHPKKRSDTHDPSRKTYGLNLGYTINLNLPATADPAVFDAIFKSLKEHLLRDDDA